MYDYARSRAFWLLCSEQYLCMRVLLFDFSLPNNTMMATSEKSVPAATTNVDMRMFLDPQCPGCPNHQQPSSFCTIVQSGLPRVDYTEAKRLREHTTFNMHDKTAAHPDVTCLEDTPRQVERSRGSTPAMRQMFVCGWGCPDSGSVRSYRSQK